MSRIFLLLNTLRYLKFIQIVYLIRYRILPQRRRKIEPTSDLAPRAGLSRRCFLPSSALTAGEFQFLNVPAAVDPATLNWRCPEKSRLWAYNLHYFDYLQSADCSRALAESLIDSWIAKNSVGTGVGWEPYPTSLRIVNWIKFLLTDSVHKKEWVSSLAVQAAWLDDNIEYHIQANHLLKNAKALVFAGAYLDGRHADRWFRKGAELFRAQMREQFLPDGGHYERSPMYHAIGVEDLLDVANLLQGSADLQSDSLLQETQATARNALTFLSDLRFPDGEIPLFNDAALRIAPPPDRLFRYGARLVGYHADPPPSGVTLIAKPDSGYYGWRNGRDMLLFDCGPIGPDYQPGHGHCDALSYELVIDGRRMIVDSGVYDYGATQERAYVRSTAAHNTVRIDRAEQSEIWDVFRVGRRSFPIDAGVERSKDGAARLFGAHDGYTRLKRGGAVHRRQIVIPEPGVWQVEDEIDGRGDHLVESFVHLHPDFDITRMGNIFSLHDPNGKIFANLILPEDLNIELSDGFYFPEFGMRLQNSTITMSATVRLPTKLHYRIEKA